MKLGNPGKVRVGLGLHEDGGHEERQTTLSKDAPPVLAPNAQLYEGTVESACWYGAGTKLKYGVRRSYVNDASLSMASHAAFPVREGNWNPSPQSHVTYRTCLSRVADKVLSEKTQQLNLQAILILGSLPVSVSIENVFRFRSKPTFA